MPADTLLQPLFASPDVCDMHFVPAYFSQFVLSSYPELLNRYSSFLMFTGPRGEAVFGLLNGRQEWNWDSAEAV